MASEQPAYVPSGRYEKAGLIGLPATIVFTAPLAFAPMAMGFALCGTIPSEYIVIPLLFYTYICVFLAVSLSPLCVWPAIRKWKMRNPGVVAAVAAPSALAGGALAAMIWFGVIFGDSTAMFVKGDISPAGYIRKLGETRVRMVFGPGTDANRPFPGANMYGQDIASLIAEICLYAGGLTFFAYFLARLPFSEQSGGWLKIVRLSRDAVVPRPEDELYGNLAPERLSPVSRAMGRGKPRLSLTLFIDPKSGDENYLCATWRGGLLGGMPQGALASGYSRKLMKIEAQCAEDIMRGFHPEKRRFGWHPFSFFDILCSDLDNHGKVFSRKSRTETKPPALPEVPAEQVGTESANTYLSGFSLDSAKLYMPSGRYEKAGVFIIPLVVLFSVVLAQTTAFDLGALRSGFANSFLWFMDSLFWAMLLILPLGWVVAIFVRVCKMRNPTLAWKLTAAAGVVGTTFSIVSLVDKFDWLSGYHYLPALFCWLVLSVLCSLFLGEAAWQEASAPFSEKNHTWLVRERMSLCGVCDGNEMHPAATDINALRPAPFKEALRHNTFLRLFLFSDTIPDGENYLCLVWLFPSNRIIKAAPISIKTVCISHEQAEEIRRRFGPVERKLRDWWIWHFPFWQNNSDRSIKTSGLADVLKQWGTRSSENIEEH